MTAKTAIADEIRRAIALRAYFIWEREGRPHGRDSEHWALAEAEILSESPVPEAVAPVQKAAKKAPTGKKPAAAKKTATVKPAKAEPKPDAPTKPAKTKKTVKPKSA